ncbi:MAG: thiol reductant ABC exporter subunit CydD [Trueperella sp.]|nr:thiol reductant ABC exporter subunit CydD [Trueperella sp.]
MKPFDGRLLKYAKATRRYIIFLVALGVVSAVLVGVQILLISGATAPVFYGQKTPRQVLPLVAALGVVFLMRTLLTYLQEAFGHRSAVHVITDLRTKTLRHAGELGDRWLAGNTSSVVTLATRGLEDLEDYYVKFLPNLFLCVTASPLLLILVASLDWISALFIIGCIPLVPIFMILIGKMTSRYAAQRLTAMQKLGAQMLDLLAGLSTLKALGREKGPEGRVVKLGKDFAAKTMQTLYVAFLSGAVLEFLTTLSTAIVAVNIGFRMVGGDVLLFEGLAVIMLTPEVFKPLREVGSQFHASANGITSAGKAFEILETPLAPHTGGTAVPDLDRATIEFRELSVYAPGRATVAPHQLSGTIKPGAVTALYGPSGAGKSTAINVLLGLLAADEGAVTVGGISITDLDRAAWWEQISWVPQRPVILPGTVLENIDNPQVSAAELAAAAELTGFSDVVAQLPQGWDTFIGQDGVGMSLGQRQRLALTRALVAPKKVVVLDEPSAHLDAVGEKYVTDVVQALRASGHTVIVIAHRAAILEIADQVMAVSSGSRDISAELAAAAAERESAQIADWLESHTTDYALPASWKSGGKQ